MKILKVSNLKKVYGKKIIFTSLDNISFNIDEGEFVGIMGLQEVVKQRF